MQGRNLPQRHDCQQKLDVILHRLFSLLFLGLLWTFPAQAENVVNPVIVLDPGHTPTKKGALGVRGIYEVSYNDQFVAKLNKVLRAASFNVFVTRSPNESIDLMDRVNIANSIRPALFLSIHHDSVQPIYLTKIDRNNHIGYQTVERIAGYSIFVSKTNPQFNDSYQFAEILGQSLQKLKRPPSLHHAEKIAGENRELLNKELGIYRFDDLVVLAKTKIPAALLEIGVIVDLDDERYISDARNQDAVCQSILEAVQIYSGYAKAMKD
jgi:N-acetylmuramoyl-L-alanine amidase